MIPSVPGGRSSPVSGSVVLIAVPGRGRPTVPSRLPWTLRPSRSCDLLGDVHRDDRRELGAPIPLQRIDAECLLDLAGELRFQLLGAEDQVGERLELLGLRNSSGRSA